MDSQRTYFYIHWLWRSSSSMTRRSRPGNNRRRKSRLTTLTSWCKMIRIPIDDSWLTPQTCSLTGPIKPSNGPRIYVSAVCVFLFLEFRFFLAFFFDQTGEHKTKRHALEEEEAHARMSFYSAYLIRRFQNVKKGAVARVQEELLLGDTDSESVGASVEADVYDRAYLLVACHLATFISATTWDLWLTAQMLQAVLLSHSRIRWTSN